MACLTIFGVTCFEVACILHEVGIKRGELLRNGVQTCHPQHGVRSVLLIFKRATTLKINSSG